VNVNRIKADVVIVGGGLAGLNSALGAVEAGARVVVMDKAKIERSGAIAGGVDHCMAYLNQGEPWDTREVYLAFVAKAAFGAVDLAVHERIFCDELEAAIDRMARIGCPLHDPVNGEYYRTRSFGQPGPYWVNFDGKNLKPLLARAVRQAGCRVLDFVTTTNLFVHEGRVQGAAGYHIRDGSYWVVESPAVVVATGNTNRLFETPSGMPFNTWLCPYDTGAAQAMAYRAGATLANMEYVRMTLVPKGFSAPGLNAFAGEGATFINALGESYMTRYHELGDKAPRNSLVYGALMEVREGRGPLFLDCTRIPKENMAILKGTLGTDKDTLPDFFRQKGIDIGVDPFEVEVSEGMQTGPLEIVGSGVKIDAQCMSNVEGLFASGDCADQMKVVHMALTGGYAAGREAAAFAARQPSDAPDERAVLAEQQRLVAPLQRASGWHYGEVETVLRKIMKEYVGPMRSEVGLQTAQKKLGLLREDLDRLKAENPHELMRCLETAELITVGEIMAAAALARKESRFIPYHYRLDFPDQDDAHWGGQILVSQQDGQISTRFQALDGDRA
jgi:adenylylsulfate reductase subunit A